jgi:hypothetical protein
VKKKRGTVIDFIKTTILGGLVFLVPVVVIVILEYIDKPMIAVIEHAEHAWSRQ